MEFVVGLRGMWDLAAVAENVDRGELHWNLSREVPSTFVVPRETSQHMSVVEGRQDGEDKIKFGYYLENARVVCHQSREDIENLSRPDRV